MSERINDNNFTENKENLKYYKTINKLNGSIIFVYSFIFMFTYFIAEGFVFSLTGLQKLLAILIFFEACYIAGWICVLPLRLWLYYICKKKGTLKQEFIPWLIDWGKVMAINSIFILPAISLAVFILFEYPVNPIITFISFFILFFILNTIRSYLIMFLVHGFYRLTEGVKYNHWKDIIVKNNITEYPIFVLKIADKANFANAFAIGFKNHGFIITSDMLLNDLTEDQFASILAHETGHLEYNDILKRLIGIGIVMLLFLMVINSFNTFETRETLLFFVILGIITILLVVFTPRLIKKQETRADIYAKNLIGSGQYLYEALDYLYNVNHVPKVLTKKEQKQIYHHHPLLEERKKVLLDLE